MAYCDSLQLFLLIGARWIIQYAMHIRRWPVLLIFFCFMALSVILCAQQSAARKYVDHTRVIYYLDDAGHEQPVKTPQDWARRRADILLGMQDARGKLPDRSSPPTLDVKVLDGLKG